MYNYIIYLAIYIVHIILTNVWSEEILNGDHFPC